MGFNQTLRVLALVVIVGFAGCLGGLGGSPDGETPGDNGGDANGGTSGDAASADWCPKGTTQHVANPQSGEQVSMQINGIIEHDGRQVCHAVWETNDAEGDIQKMEMFYTEDESYRKIIMYDENGDVVQEFEMTQ